MNERIHAQQEFIDHQEMKLRKLEQETNIKQYQKKIITEHKEHISSIMWQIGDMAFTFENNCDGVIKEIDETIERMEKRIQPMKVQVRRLAQEYKKRLENEAHVKATR